jgi:hypothetical protein
MKSLVHPSYFPSISHYVAMVQADTVVFEIEDNFKNRQIEIIHIFIVSNGIQLLNIPIKHTKQNHQKTKILSLKMNLTGRNNISNH